MNFIIELIFLFINCIYCYTLIEEYSKKCRWKFTKFKDALIISCKKIWNFYSSYELNFVGILIPSVISIIILNCGIISSWIVYLFLGLIRILAKGYLYIFKEKKEKKI